MLDSIMQTVVTAACVGVGIFVAIRLIHVYLKTGKRVTRIIDGKAFEIIAGDSIFDIIYQEIYTDHCYFKYGVSLEGIEKPFVIDAGANVGLFSRWIAEQYPTATVHAAEPVPPIHECAAANCAEFKDRVHMHQIGLGEKAGTAPFSYTPATTGGSTMFEGDLIKPVKKYPIRMVAAAILTDAKHSRGKKVSSILDVASSILKTPVVGDIAFFTLFVPAYLCINTFNMCAISQKQQINCTLMTLQEMLEIKGNTPLASIPKIDLLKIDVEAAEYAVTIGGSEELWAKVQQVVIEITDVDDRVAKLRKFLEVRGFKNIHIDSEQWETHKYLDIYTMFATRK